MCLVLFHCHKNVQSNALAYEIVLFKFLIVFSQACFILMWHFVSSEVLLHGQNWIEFPPIQWKNSVIFTEFLSKFWTNVVNSFYFLLLFLFLSNVWNLKRKKLWIFWNQKLFCLKLHFQVLVTRHVSLRMFDGRQLKTSITLKSQKNILSKNIFKWQWIWKNIFVTIEWIICHHISKSRGKQNTLMYMY